jgi:hypothetical protein
MKMSLSVAEVVAHLRTKPEKTRRGVIQKKIKCARKDKSYSLSSSASIGFAAEDIQNVSGYADITKVTYYDKTAIENNPSNQVNLI